jgi:hypothetical protein
MGIVVSLFRRIAVTGGHGYQSIPPCEKEENCKAMPAAVKGLKGTAFLHAHAKNCKLVLVMLIMTSPYYYLINPPVISSALPTHEP